GVGPNAEAFAAPAAEKKKAHEVLALEGGVLIDPVEKAIFAAKTEGGIEAIDITTGKALWQTKKEEGKLWPVAVYGRTLVVRLRDRPLRIAALDLDARGKMLWKTEPVLPDWVKGPKWMKDKPTGKGGLDRQALESDFLDAITRGTYLCEERIEKGKFVMRWRATSQPLALRNPGKAP